VWSFIGIAGNKKGPLGSLSFAHGELSPGGYAALPMRLRTRMIFLVMGADTNGVIPGSQPKTDIRELLD
jgi:hypothetical protein